jgi:hypothetical protein
MQSTMLELVLYLCSGDHIRTVMSVCFGFSFKTSSMSATARSSPQKKLYGGSTVSVYCSAYSTV